MPRPLFENPNLVPRGCDPFGQRQGSGPLATWDFESTNHGLPVTLRRIKGKPQTAETALLWVISTFGCYAFVSTANRNWS